VEGFLRARLQLEGSAWSAELRECSVSTVDCDEALRAVEGLPGLIAVAKDAVTRHNRYDAYKQDGMGCVTAIQLERATAEVEAVEGGSMRVLGLTVTVEGPLTGWNEARQAFRRTLAEAWGLSSAKVRLLGHVGKVGVGRFELEVQVETPCPYIVIMSIYGN